MRASACLVVVLALAGCVSDQTRADIANSAQAIDNAAASQAASPQRAAIRANAAAIAHAVGHDLPLTADALQIPTPGGATP